MMLSTVTAGGIPETISAGLWVILAFSAFLVSISKTGVPGLGPLVVVVLLFTLPAKASVGFLLPILIAGSDDEADLKRNRAVAAGAIDHLIVEPFHVLSVLRTLDDTLKLFG